MSGYMSRLFPRSNSSFLFSSGNAIQAQVLRLREETFLVDSGLGFPRLCMKDELTRVPSNQSTRFENQVGFAHVGKGETVISKKLLERCLIDLVAGDPLIKERTAVRFKDVVGSTDVMSGESNLVLPRRFRQNRVWTELNKSRRLNTRVKGFVIGVVRGGYAVAIAGNVAFLSGRLPIARRILFDRFTIESINPKTKNIVVY